VTSTLFLRGGTVLTLGGKTPNLPVGDVLIEGDRIAEVGRDLRAPRDAETIDCTDTIVMPGFVDTHRHTWTSLFRNAGDVLDADVSAASFREHLGTDDVYAATLIGLLGAIASGITTVVDRCEVPPTDATIEATRQAHVDAGVRTVLVTDATSTIGPPADGQAFDGPEGDGPAFAFGSTLDAAADLDDVAGGWRAARDAGLRIHAHVGAAGVPPGTIAALAGRGVLGPDVTLVHLAGADDADIRAIADAGAAVSLAPSSDMAAGRGAPPIQELMDRDVRPGLGVEHERVAPGDLFAQMRQTISLQHATVFDRKLMGKGSLPKLMSTRDVIRYATVDGARVAGLQGVTGSIEPGLQADIIVLRADRPNVWPINDAIGAVVWGMDTSNLDHVIVGGRRLLDAGALVADVEDARVRASRARERVVAAAGLTPAGASA
jgi:5-methylthioadenosine/S-adenosylhomocysteine deaminase